MGTPSVPFRKRPGFTYLSLAAGVVAAGILGLLYKIVEPVLSGQARAERVERRIELPTYNYAVWGRWPVQENGRVKPFATAAMEAVTQICGRANFQKLDPVALVLQWMVLGGMSPDGKATDWETYPFILCDHFELRREIYAHCEEADKEQREKQLHSKYIAPADLRSSPGFKALTDEAQKLRRRDEEKAQQQMSPAMRKAEEVLGRLALYDSLTQANLQNLAGPKAAAEAGAPNGRKRSQEDPFHVVALDKVPGGPWFSLAELRDIRDNPERWRDMMRERLAYHPQLYINPECVDALREFQRQVKSGEGQKALDELGTELKARNDKVVKKLADKDKAANGAVLGQLLYQMMETGGHEKMVELLHGVDPNNKEQLRTTLLNGFREYLDQKDDEALKDLKQRVVAARSQRYNPDDPRFRMLHLNYLEKRFPDVYKESEAWQECPSEEADHILAAYAGVRTAYLSGDPARFDQASNEFFRTIQYVSEEKAGSYPGSDTAAERWAGLLWGRPPANPDRSLLGLEMTFNRVQPFLWAAVIMAGAILFFLGSLALNSRLSYWLGFAFFFASLTFQLFGFYARITIAARPPVSNMYETLIFVPFMASLFALILEYVYRRGVIILAGSVVATLGLILAYLLPVDLGLKITNLVPVLRSNYWLTIHVLTIVSSYAGGALAWALGNIALILITFGQPRRELVKTLAQFSYRAMQIAVLLLAAGTFLGGWWAAESWGRFWGWDPKEVWALIALVCYVIPLHMRYIGWVKDFGMAVAAVVCFSAIVFSWYGVNFVLAAGLHSYGFGAGSPWMVFLCTLLDLEWVIVASMIYLGRREASLGGPNPAAA